MPPEKQWESLPEHILVTVFSFLAEYTDRTSAARTCQSWNEAFRSAYLWSHFNFYFYSPRQARSLECIKQYGCHLKSVTIELDQQVEANRENACRVITELASQKERRLKFLKVKFTGENPCFYAGKEFVSALLVLCGPPAEEVNLVQRLQELDLSGMTVQYDDALFNALSDTHPSLEKLNIQNRMLVCQVSPQCMLRLVTRCRRLRDLRIFKCSASEDMMLAFTENDRVPLEHLSLACRREEKFGKSIGEDTWKIVTRKLPKLRVSLYFDHTCPLGKVAEIMKPGVPLSCLRMETYIFIFDEVRLAIQSYKDSLEKLVLTTPITRNSEKLNTALLEMAVVCHKLNTLHVYCVLEQDTIDKIKEQHPGIKCTLKSSKDDFPVV